MISFNRFFLDNGLQVIVHEDPTTEVAVLNILYDVGSRDEDKDKTGFAHLFEHLMFGGSVNIPSFDDPLQKVGGESNAFTNPDFTNYYITLPAINIETAFWLESDRMLSLSFDPEVLMVQKKVVIEEFKQRYLDQPYGDSWLKLRPLAYKVHPYQWPTIGKDISHIEKATLDDVKEFFFRFYVPQNAIMVVAGNVSTEQVKKLADKWFGPIPGGKKTERKILKEPRQNESRRLEIEADVPLSAIYKTYHMAGRNDKNYYSADLISDILGRSNSSRLYDSLIKSEKLFNSINAFITGSIDPGLLMIQGKINNKVDIGEAEEKINDIVNELKENIIAEEELTKVKNQAEATVVFSEVELLNRAINLAHSALMGNPEYINQESDKIQAVNIEEIYREANEILVPENSSTLVYHSSIK